MLYKHILVTVDLLPLSKQVLERANDMATTFQCKVSVLHVMEHSPLAFGGEFSIPIDPNLEIQLEAAARHMLSDLSMPYEINVENQYVKWGSVKHAVNDLAVELKADLIVAGSHNGKSHHGLGSQANAILHAAYCDVLIIKLKA